MFEDIDAVLSFWFGYELDQEKIIADKTDLWWGKDSEHDQYIIKTFAGQYQRAINGELEHWLQNAKGQLALIVVLDQFSRVIHRNTRDAFAQDKTVLDISLQGIEVGADKMLSPIERVFYYMPLEHSEDLDTQNQCVELFRQLLFEVPESLEEQFTMYLEFAESHQRIIERFHRFPHRNSVLNRTSSAEELEFLERPGSSF